MDNLTPTKQHSGIITNSTASYITDSLNETMNLSITSSSTEAFPATTTAGIPPPNRKPVTLEDLLSQYWEYNLSRDIGLYGYPIIIILGTLGNLLIFVIMLRPKLRHRTTCFYMTVVSVFDTLVLYFACLRQWLALLHNVDPLTMSEAACKGLNFCAYTCFDVASWLLVLMTVDRFLVVQFPFHAQKISTVPKARRIVVILVIIMILLNGHFFWGVKLDERGFCNYIDEFEHFHNDIWPWVDAAVYSFAPFCFLLLFNILIIVIHRRSVIVRRTTLNASQPRKRKSVQQGERVRMSTMLLTVTFSFLVLSAPNVILTSIRNKYFDFSVVTMDTLRDIALYGLLATVTNMCLYLNHAVNFFLYCMTGQLFRRELRHLFKCNLSEGHKSRSSVYSDGRTRHARQSESSTPSTPTPSSPVWSNITMESYV